MLSKIITRIDKSELEKEIVARKDLFFHGKFDDDNAAKKDFETLASLIACISCEKVPMSPFVCTECNASYCEACIGSQTKCLATGCPSKEFQTEPQPIESQFMMKKLLRNYSESHSCPSFGAVDPQNAYEAIIEFTSWKELFAHKT